MRNWHRSIIAKVMLIITAIATSAVAALSFVLLMGFSSTLSMSMNDLFQEVKAFEDTDGFENLLYSATMDVLNGVQIKEQLETDGKYNPDQLVDVMEYYDSQTITGKNESGLAYTVEELGTWSRKDGNRELEEIVVCKKTDNTYHYYYMNEFEALLENGSLRLEMDDESYRQLIEELEKRCGRKIIGNKSASGTEILEELAEEEIATGHMIVYTSADSVLQICGNEETFGLEELYRCCEIARELTMRPEWKVGRVIARPYTGMKKGEFKRTANRHDYALKPYGKTVLNALEEAGYDVISVGKINDIFAGEGITRAYKSQSSVHGMEQTIEIAKEKFSGLCFVNLVDFDAVWGHRRDVYGYAKELEKFDRKLEELLTVLTEEDLLMITADHGTDPTYKGTDHTREDVPLLIYSKEMEKGGQMEEQETFAVIGATIADNFDIKMPEGTIGRSIWQ